MKVLKTILSRVTFIIIAFVLQLALTLFVFSKFAEYAEWIESVIRLLSLIIVLYMIKNSKHLSSDMMWIVLIIAFPIPGTLIYLVLGADLLSSRTFRQIRSSTKDAQKYYVQDEEVMKDFKAVAGEYNRQVSYISGSQKFPLYRNTGFDYYNFGEIGFPVMLEELRKAEKFIFLEYFIIEEGEMWNSMLDILVEKAAAGVDVRVMYDDLGSFFTLSKNYAKKLEEKGVKCISFNRINPILNIIINHRDHRKIMVIDGKTAFSGGVNLADEYINAIVKHGRWKDNIIRIKGDAVWSYTVMFLTHWNAVRNEDADFAKFRAEETAEEKTFDGYIAPYGETPLSDEITAQNVYLSILNQAKDYCYIFTPYLIIDTDMINTLILAAKSGIDVRLVTPGIPDKKMVYMITRSYYRQLIEGGVKIIEYTPGFVHSKVFVSDDKVATVGTVNLDYRSLYLHFENGTYLYDCSKIAEIRDDILSTISEGHEVTLEECKSLLIKEFFISILRLFAPLM